METDNNETDNADIGRSKNHIFVGENQQFRASIGLSVAAGKFFCNDCAQGKCTRQ